MQSIKQVVFALLLSFVVVDFQSEEHKRTTMGDTHLSSKDLLALMKIVMHIYTMNLVYWCCGVK